MKPSVELLRSGVRGALEVRLRAQLRNDQPVCVYDLADHLGLEVKFCSGKSLGGMYSKSSQTILVPTLRPPGRRAFTCAHEIGHWYFDHGSRIDAANLMEQTSDDDPAEQLANVFASHLLMSSWAVKKAFEKRKLKPEHASPVQMYSVAMQLGVGYSTLVLHLLYALRLISQMRADFLQRTSPADIRNELLGNNKAPYLVIADIDWAEVPIDLQVGDMAILPSNTKVEGQAASVIDSNRLGVIIQAQRPGISRAELLDSNWAAYVRVSRKDYEGRSRYRHLEDPDVDGRTTFDL